MTVMRASMVRLPFAAGTGDNSLLLRLVDSNISFNAYGCETLNAIIDYKWQRFAKRSIYTKMIIYLIYIAAYTAFAIIIR